MPGTCSSCGQALHSDLSRTLGRCGPCRWGEDNALEPAWRRLVPKPGEETKAAQGDKDSQVG